MLRVGAGGVAVPRTLPRPSSRFGVPTPVHPDLLALDLGWVAAPARSDPGLTLWAGSRTSGRGRLTAVRRVLAPGCCCSPWRICAGSCPVPGSPIRSRSGSWPVRNRPTASASWARCSSHRPSSHRWRGCDGTALHGRRHRRRTVGATPRDRATAEHAVLRSQVLGRQRQDDARRVVLRPGRHARPARPHAAAGGVGAGVGLDTPVVEALHPFGRRDATTGSSPDGQHLGRLSR